MSGKVTVIDYGIGNLFSVRRAFEICGAEVQLTSDPAEIDAAERLVLPGVGAFADGMAGLRSRALVEPIRRYAATGRPLLGICLGMQLLATSSEEFGHCDGLDLIPGQVRSLPVVSVDGHRQKIPSIGWAELHPPAGQSWAGSVLQDLVVDQSSVYLVHSFEVIPDHREHRLAEYDYGGRSVCAAIASGQVVGCQFHPEKSGPIGLKIISAFARKA